MSAAICPYCDKQVTHEESIIGPCCDDCLSAALVEWESEGEEKPIVDGFVR